MIIVEPVALGDVACTRASTGTYFDRNGVLQSAPANTLRVTYDLAELTTAPYALVEPATTNLFTYSQYFESAWSASQGIFTLNAGVAPDGNASATRFASSPNATLHYLGQNAPLTPGLTYVISFFVKSNLSGQQTFRLFGADGTSGNLTAGTTWRRYSFSFVATSSTFHGLTRDSFGNALDLLIWGAQLEVGATATSYIFTGAAQVTRAADVIAAGAGVVYSSVPITEPNYDATTTYAKGALVHDPATHNVYLSIADANKGKALADASGWAPRGATNRWAMLDQYNNTQTTNADEIILVVSPQAISQGLYLGNMYADEVRISVVDLVEGRVYSETSSLVDSNSGSSFFSWCFKRIQRRDYFGTLKMPPYANALITICLRKIGGIAKCGMCAVGPMDDFGPTLTGLSAEGKDYSTTTFAFDGTSTTNILPYAKRMGCDVLMDNDQIDYVQSRLFGIRQRLIIWFGGPYGTTVVAGRYGSFKIVISYPTKALMSLTIEGAV